MDYPIIWTRTAFADLEILVRYIAEDHPEAAERFGNLLISKTEILKTFPLIGRRVKGLDEDLREIIIPPYRVIYRVEETSQSATIVRIWHSSREKLEIPDEP